MVNVTNFRIRKEGNLSCTRYCTTHCHIDQFIKLRLFKLPSITYSISDGIIILNPNPVDFPYIWEGKTIHILTTRTPVNSVSIAILLFHSKTLRTLAFNVEDTQVYELSITLLPHFPLFQILYPTQAGFSKPGTGSKSMPYPFHGDKLKHKLVEQGQNKLSIKGISKKKSPLIFNSVQLLEIL